MAAGWAVRCEGFTTKPSPSRDAAENLRVHIEDAGHCLYPHEVVEVER